MKLVINNDVCCAHMRENWRVLVVVTTTGIAHGVRVTRVLVKT